MIYENMLSGAFIYSIGVIAGRRNLVNVMDSINHIQQTPYDKPIGDLLANWGGKTFIVEFKKNRMDIRSEFEKDHKKKMLKELLSNQELKELSKSIHFLGFGIERENRIDLQFEFYLSQGNSEGISNSKFIEALLMPNSKIGSSNKNDVVKYLTFLMKNSKFSDVDALVVHVASDGRPVFIKVDSYLKFEYSLNQKIENNQSQLQSINRTPTKGYGMNS